MELNSHGTITEHNLNQKYQDTKKHGPLRLKISRPIVDAMNQLGWIWSLDGGDLLAAFRDGGKMLPHDDDFDLWVFTNDVTLESSHQEKVQLLQKMLEAIRQKLPKPLEVRIVSSYCYKLQVYDPQYGYYLFRDHPYHNVTCDLSLVAPMKKVQPEGEELYRLLHEQCAKYNLNIQKKHLVPVKVNGIMFEGYQYNCPADTESYLKTHYGYLGKESCYDKESGLYKKKPEKVA